MTRTYDAATYRAARRAWEEGDFGPEWAELRRLSWDRGFPYPPSGTKHDDYDVAEPSQRAVIWQWLDWQPQQTKAIVGRSNGWSQVVYALIGLRKRLEEDADYADRETDAERSERPGYREAVTSLKAVVERIRES